MADFRTEISQCGKYRYSLWRETEAEGNRTVNFICLNPSTADVYKDDPTVARMRKFALTWGFKHLLVTNLYAFRATTPSDLLFVKDPIGPENDDWVKKIAKASDRCVAAWGATVLAQKRERVVREWFHKESILLYAMEYTSSGFPMHPLARGRNLIPYTNTPQIYPFNDV